jgi:hypothetical protein
VTANVNPNLKSTNVSVSYGPTTAYGSTTPPQTFEGNTSGPFSASLTGLTPNTTYHARVTASNGDGTTNSADLTFTTPAIPPVPHTAPSPPPPPLSAAVVHASTSAADLSLTIACGGGSASDRCRGPVTLASHVAARAGKAVAVATGVNKAKKKKPKPKPKANGVQVAAGSYSVASGHQVKIKLALNAAGRKVLTQRYQLPATLLIGGTTRITRSVTFSYRRISSPVSFTWSFNSRFSVAEDLTITRLPPKPEVVVICQGRGCPFSERTFHPTGGKLALAPALAHRHLAPHATVELQINSRNEVGKVLVFTIRSDKQPTLAASCLAPGASHPTACA